VIPNTSVLGAILLTGYLGGATAANVCAGSAAFNTSFPIVFCVFIWLGLFLREGRLRNLIPFVSERWQAPIKCCSDYKIDPHQESARPIAEMIGIHSSPPTAVKPAIGGPGGDVISLLRSYGFVYCPMPMALSAVIVAVSSGSHGPDSSGPWL
jgi:hypothetical protein